MISLINLLYCRISYSLDINRDSKIKSNTKPIDCSKLITRILHWTTTNNKEAEKSPVI